MPTKDEEEMDVLRSDEQIIEKPRGAPPLSEPTEYSKHTPLTKLLPGESGGFPSRGFGSEAFNFMLDEPTDKGDVQIKNLSQPYMTRTKNAESAAGSGLESMATNISKEEMISSSGSAVQGR